MFPRAHGGMPAYDPDAVEDAVKQEWEENDTRTRVIERNQGNDRFYFLDGPPYATGSIHMGTGMNKILKDFYLRLHRKLGYNVHSQPGYDVHGLPIENKVEEEEGFETKQDIEAFGVDNFVEKCKAFVDAHIAEMNHDFNDMGVWMTWENPYVTYHDYYIEGAWETFKRAYEQDYLYKGEYPVHVCTRCQTAVAYNEIEHTTVEDPEVYVALPLDDEDGALLIWTTTPWTLPANTGAMMHPGYEYALVDTGTHRLWMARERVEPLMDAFGVADYDIVDTRMGEEFAGRTYSNPLADLVPAQDDVEGRVVLSSRYVHLDDGTGIVHSAPGHGKEDYAVGQEEDLPLRSPVDLQGRFTTDGGTYEGEYVKDADEQIMDDLDERGALVHAGTMSHEYPKCWRCDTPLLQLAIPQWFFRVTSIRDDLIEANEDVNWVPDWAGKKFHEWLEALGDWPISRQRYWGIPLPIWECRECDHTVVLGDRDELPEVPDDLHRPYIDEVTLDCDECGGTMERVPDVLDVWFDSGVAPWASLKNPDIDFSFEDHHPVDLELEGFDQIRGWWNSQFITSMMTYDQRPFDSVVYHGKVMLEGQEMSKSKGIVVSPSEVIEKYGRDMLRFYILTKDPSEDWSFEWEGMDATEEFMNILWNTYRYRDTYAADAPDAMPDELAVEDRWILSRLHSTIQEVAAYGEALEAYHAAHAVRDFAVEDLSRGYIQMVRDRLRPNADADDRAAAAWTLDHVARILLQVLSPFVPYVTDHLWDGAESVHMHDLPEVDEDRMDADLERRMAVVQAVEQAVATLRQQNGIALRHPVERVTVSGSADVQDAVESLQDLLAERLNARAVEFEQVELNREVKLDYAAAGPAIGDDIPAVEAALSEADHDELAETIEQGDAVELDGMAIAPDLFEVRTHVPEGMEGEEFSQGTVYLDTDRTDELLDEAFVNEVVRAVQQARKEAGLEVTDTVELAFTGDTAPLEEHADRIRRRVNVAGIAFQEEPDFPHTGTVAFEGREAEFAISEPR